MLADRNARADEDDDDDDDVQTAAPGFRCRVCVRAKPRGISSLGGDREDTTLVCERRRGEGTRKIVYYNDVVGDAASVPNRIIPVAICCSSKIKQRVQRVKRNMSRIFMTYVRRPRSTSRTTLLLYYVYGKSRQLLIT